LQQIKIKMRTQHHQHEHPTFEKVWQMFQQTDKEIQEDRRKAKEAHILWEKKFNKLEGFFTSQWGKFIEALVSGDLINLLKERNIFVNRTTTRAKTIYKGREYEFDIIAINGNEIVVIEVKTNLKVEDVKEFLDELKVFKEIFKEYKQNKIYGAVAYLHQDEEADKYAYRQGLFVLKATGKSAVITNDKKFKPKEF